MKNFTTLVAWSLILTMVITESCSKGGSGGGSPAPPPPPPPPGTTITVSSNKTTLFADGWDEVTFTVKNQNNVDVTGSSQIYIDNMLYTKSTFWTSTAGTYRIKAMYNGIASPVIDLIAQDPGPSPFSQKILVEDYTGTWCGHCPRVGIALDNYVNSGNPNCIVVANHGPSNDPFTFVQHQTLASNVYGSNPPVAVTGYPSVFVDRSFKWNEQTSQLNTQFTNRRPPIGLAFETLISGTNVQATAKVKFDVNTSADLKLVVYLVEDGQIYPQVNYNYFGLPNPISNYEHNGILRASGTNLFGDMIDKASQTKGTIFTKILNFNASNFNINNCRLVGFVVVENNNYGRKGVINVQTVQAGENVDFN